MWVRKMEESKVGNCDLCDRKAKHFVLFENGEVFMKYCEHHFDLHFSSINDGMKDEKENRAKKYGYL